MRDAKWAVKDAHVVIVENDGIADLLIKIDGIWRFPWTHRLPKMGYIYRITNQQTGKIYIGKTIQHDPRLRWNEHQFMCKQEKGGCPALRDAVRKYGIDAFVFEVLIICFDEDCDRWEKEYIKKYNCIVPNGHNFLEGGQGGAGFRGKRHTETTKARIVGAVKKFCSNPKYMQMMREKGIQQMANIDRKEYGKKIVGSEKYQKALAEGRVGGAGHKEGTLSAETKEKIRKSVLKYYEENGKGHPCDIIKHRDVMSLAKGRKVDQYDKDGKFIKTYDSISAAAREINLTSGSIQFVVKGRHKTAGGFVWKYHTEPELEVAKIENEIIYES